MSSYFVLATTQSLWHCYGLSHLKMRKLRFREPKLINDHKATTGVFGLRAQALNPTLSTLLPSVYCFSSVLRRLS
jgi:hypothetical protein